MKTKILLADDEKTFRETFLKVLQEEGFDVDAVDNGLDAIDAIRKHGAVYLIATGGAAYLVSKSIRSARVVAFEEMGMEAIYEFEVENMPVTVAVDSKGKSIHDLGPAHWRQQIAGIPVTQT